MTIIGSTLSGNQASWDGGGIYNTLGKTVNVTNSTLSANQANSHGGGIYNMDGTITLNNVTITGNTADNDNNFSGDGGGVFRFFGTVNLRNTIIAKNTDMGGQAPDGSGTLTSLDYNLVGDNTGCTITPQAHDQIGTGGSPIDPRLGALADNGGATQTHALQVGSPAIDKGHCTDSGGGTVTKDQRGVARPQGHTCDVGAYEAEPRLSIDKTVTPVDNVTYRDVVTYTVVLSNGGAGHGTSTMLTDTLPSQVDFASWVEQPAGANQANDQITWNGTVTSTKTVTFTFAVNHVGDYGDVVTNTAEYSNTLGGSDYATFTVVVTPTSYLPIIQNNNVITP